jgi:predicted amidophosphoribosyltransferase
VFGSNDERQYIMALIECPECKKEISDHASSCPHCGYELKPQRVEKTVVVEKSSGGVWGAVGCLLVILLILVIIGMLL